METSAGKNAIIQHFKKTLKKIAIKGEDDEWFILIPTEYTIYSSENIMIQSVELIGKGDFSRQVLVTIYYRINKSCQTKIKRFDCENIDSAIKYIFEFPFLFKLCNECGILIDRNGDCVMCEFFKEYRKYNDIPDQHCAICQELVYRTTLKCGHMFHFTCLTKLEPIAIKCPVCRTELTTDEVENIFYQDDDSDEENE